MEESRYRQYEPVFGVWHITRFLGEGSLGKVFEIRQETFGMVSTAALKIITLPRDGDETNPCGSSEGAVRQIVENILLVNKLRGSGNIVGCDNYQVIRHAGGTGWDILIQMELLTPLDRYVRQKGGLSPQETVRLGIDLCRALEMCRRHNVVHRDIKPDNIFVSEDGTFKLGDFSVAGVRSGAYSWFAVRGTPSYMAPEMYQDGEGDFPADIYSLGLVLYQMLNGGCLPFLPAAPAPVNFADRENALRKRMSGAALPKPLYAEGRLARIVLKACAFDPGRRYPDPARMRQELEKICLPPERDEKTGPFRRRGDRAPEELIPEKTIDPATGSRQTVVSWPESWRAEDILRWSVSFGDCPIRNFRWDGDILTAWNTFDVCRDGGKNFPPEYFFRVRFSLPDEQKERLRRCLEAIPRERWSSDAVALEYDRQCPTGYTRRNGFSCEMRTGEKFDYLPGRNAAFGFVRLCRCLEDIVRER